MDKVYYLFPSAFHCISKAVSPVISNIIFNWSVALVVYKSLSEKQGATWSKFQFSGNVFIGCPRRHLLFRKRSYYLVVILQNFVQWSFKALFFSNTDTWMKIGDEIYKGAFRSTSQPL